MAIMDEVPDVIQTPLAASGAHVEQSADPMAVDTTNETPVRNLNGLMFEASAYQSTTEPELRAEDGDVRMVEADAPQNGLLNAAELVTSVPAAAETIMPPPQIVEASVTRISEEALPSPAQIAQTVSDVRDEEPLPASLPRDDRDEDLMAVDQPVETSISEQKEDDVTLLPSKVEQATTPAGPVIPPVDITPVAELSPAVANSIPSFVPTAPVTAVDTMEAPSSEVVPSPAATGQVRQRDDDDEAERSAKRAKVSPDAEAALPSVEAAAPEPSIESAELVEPIEPAASAAPVVSVEPTAPAVAGEPQESIPVADTVETVAPSTNEQPATTETAVTDAPAVAESTTAQPAAMAAPELPASGPNEFDKNPLTKSQTRYLLDSVRKAKKIKAAIPFLNAVDPVALNIPSYPTVVPNPMDLGSIEDRLKNDKYTSANELWADFELMATNALAFNGPNHPVTQHGYNLRAYFNKLMQSIPKGDAASSEPPKKAAVSPKPMLPRRESRHIPVAKPSPTPAPKPTPKPAVAKPKAEPKKHEPVLDSNGVPVIRRASESERPKREIIKPQPKDMPYSHIKPKKKSAQLELKFCEQVVLKEIKKPKNQVFAYPFMQPVDVVALNIPTYHQVIKKPMDFGTIERNLQRGEYNNAKEFAQDARLVFKNCFQFNGSNEPVHLWGKQVEALFEELFEQKDEWIAANQPVSEPSDEESEAESSEEEPETQEERMRKVAELQKQIAALNSQMFELMNAPLTSKPKKKSSKSKSKADSSKSKKRSSVGAAAPASKSSKPKKSAKPKKLTLEQKRYVSEGIMMLDEVNMRKAVQTIRNGVPKLKDVNDDELELDVDEIPDNVLQTLHKFVKDYRRANGTDVADDDDYEDPADEPSAGGGPTAGGGSTTKSSSSSHRKKSKPMSAREQERSIAAVREKLSQFDERSGSDGANNDEESSDDASSSSEEE